MSKDDQIIMAVKRDLLLGNDSFQGFRNKGEVDYELRVLKDYEWKRRGEIEENPDYKQPIGYTLVVNPALGRVFTYQRSSEDKNYGERRLQGKWSWGVGGHIERSDVLTGNPIRESILREVVGEEVEIIGGGVKKIEVLGYVNDDSDDVGKVHFGILYVIETDSEDVRPKDQEMVHGKLIPYGYLETICLSTNYDVEGWSKISFDPLVKYLRKT